MKMTFTVDRQSIRRTDDFTVVGDSVQYLQAQFTFLGDWDENHIILPIFERGTRVYIPKLLKSGKYLDDGNTCLIPHEALVGEGVMYVSLLDETDGVRITTNKAAVCIEQSGYTAKVEESLTPTPTVYDEILRLYGELKNMISMLPVTPDSLKLENNLLQLTAKGEAVGQGVPLPAPWAKQITYNKESLQDIMRVSAYKDSVNDKICAEFVVDFVSLMYQRNETEILSVTPLLSEIPPITVVVDSADEYKTQVYIDPKCVNISESFHLNVDGEALDVSIAELQFLALDNNTQFERFVQALRSAESGTSDGLGVLRYTYRFLLPPTETEMQNAIYDEICVLLRDHLTDFTVQYSEITYTKNAEVLKIE